MGEEEAETVGRGRLHTGCMASLQHIQGPPHVSAAQRDQGVRGLAHDLDIFFLDHFVHKHAYVDLFQRAEPEPSAPRQEGRGELVGVVGDDAEARIGRVLLHDAAKGHLRRVGHGIGLVEDDQLVARKGTGARARPPHAEDLLRRGERLDLFAHDVDAAVVRRVQLQNHLPHVIHPVYPPGQREYGRGLAGAGGAIEKQVRQPVGVDKLVDGCEDVLMSRDVGQGRRSIFLDPWPLSACLGYGKRARARSLAAYHGRVSSASTGRFAADRLPFVASAEKVMSLGGGGTSTSISSSKSDILAAGGSNGRKEWCSSSKLKP